MLDEPITHPDPNTRDDVLADLLTATRDRSLLLVTHDLAGPDRLDEVVVVIGGRVVARGDDAELRRRPGWYAAAAAGRSQDHHSDGVPRSGG